MSIRCRSKICSSSRAKFRRRSASPAIASAPRSSRLWRQLAEKRGFSVSELFGGRGRGKSSAAKFANPDNRAETWTGRGRKPNWLVAKLSKGAKMTDFAI